MNFEDLPEDIRHMVMSHFPGEYNSIKELPEGIEEYVMQNLLSRMDRGIMDDFEEVPKDLIEYLLRQINTGYMDFGELPENIRENLMSYYMRKYDNDGKPDTPLDEHRSPYYAHKALWEAVLHDDVDAVKNMVEDSRNRISAYDEDVLDYATRNGYIEIIQRLMRRIPLTENILKTAVFEGSASTLDLILAYSHRIEYDPDVYNAFLNREDVSQDAIKLILDDSPLRVYASTLRTWYKNALKYYNRDHVLVRLIENYAKHAGYTL